MQQHIQLEIPEHLRHKDYALAVRRLLDLSYDTGDLSLMKETAAFSKAWNSNLYNSRRAACKGYRIVEKHNINSCFVITGYKYFQAIQQRCV